MSCLYLLLPIPPILSISLRLGFYPNYWSETVLNRDVKDFLLTNSDSQVLLLSLHDTLLSWHIASPGFLSFMPDTHPLSPCRFLLFSQHLNFQITASGLSMLGIFSKFTLHVILHSSMALNIIYTNNTQIEFFNPEPLLNSTLICNCSPQATLGRLIDFLNIKCLKWKLRTLHPRLAPSAVFSVPLVATSSL